MAPEAATPSAREVGWAAFDTPEARAISANKARVVVIVLALQVVALQFVLSITYPADVHEWIGPLGPLGTSGALFLLLSVFYLVFAALLWLRVPGGSVFGFILCVFSMLVWLVLLGGGPALYATPERSSWVALLSIAVSVAIVAGLLHLRDANRASDTVAAA